MSPLKQEIIQTLSEIYDLADDIRFGQLMCNLCEIASCQTNIHAWDIEDDEMLAQLRAHRNDLQNMVSRRAAEAAKV
jgi:hypothetical protein